MSPGSLSKESAHEFKSHFALSVAAALLSLAGVANAVIVPGVYNTGPGVDGVALAAGDGQVDANYVVVSSNVASIVPDSHALTYHNPAYFPHGPLSRIVNATGNGNGATGEVTTFETIFSLAGFKTANATLSGRVLYDNFGTISLNGHAIGGTITGFGSLTSFGSSANYFGAGLNHLDFTLNNIDGPDAFQVAGLTVTAAPGVPEPTSWVLMLAGFGLVGFAARRRRNKTVAA